MEQDLTPYPASERVLCRWVAALFQRGIAGSSVKLYLAAVRYSQIAVGLGDPQMSDWPQLSYVVRGMKKLKLKGKERPRLPITPQILLGLIEIWGEQTDVFNGQMLTAASCMCFFGFLRSGEVVAPPGKDFDSSVHLSVGDVKVDSRAKPTYLEVSIKASKTDVFRKGVTVVLGATGKKLCPVATILQYMSNPRPAAASPKGAFFVFSDGSALTRAKLVKEMRAALEARGIRPSDYAGHSFRIGAATTAATCGMLDSLIKTLGRWESTAYTLYIRTPRKTLCSVAKSLASSSP